MFDLQNTATYKLSNVLAETGLSADVVRVWEKRYGLPAPRRTEGGHRLYSRRDIRTLQWLQARVAEGMRISKAVRRWRELEAAGLDPLAAEATEADASLGAVLSEWLLACLDFDERRAEAVLDAVFDAHPPEAVCLNVLLPGLHQIGEMWYRNQASVQQEHFTSELAMRRLHRLMAAAPPPSRDALLLVATPSGETHALPALLLAVLLRWRGWPVRFLGADLPLQQLEHALSITRPAAALYAAQLLTSLPALQAVGQTLRDVGIPLGYAGWIFNRRPSLHARIPGFFLGETFPEALDAVDVLVKSPLPLPDVPAAPAEYRQATEALSLASAGIAAEVTARLPQIPAESLQTALRFTLDQWRAALLFGDPELLRAEMDWVAGMLQSRALDDGRMEAYWQAWRNVVADHFGPAATPILEFFEK